MVSLERETMSALVLLYFPLFNIFIYAILNATFMCMICILLSNIIHLQKYTVFKTRCDVRLALCIIDPSSRPVATIFQTRLQYQHRTNTERILHMCDTDNEQ